MCRDGSFYSGVTSNLRQRIIDHKKGWGGFYTRKQGAIKLVYKKKFLDRRETLQRESQIKGWRRKKKINLIKGKIT